LSDLLRIVVMALLQSVGIWWIGAWGFVKVEDFGGYVR
jgi:hypothetical protein